MLVCGLTSQYQDTEESNYGENGQAGQNIVPIDRATAADLSDKCIFVAGISQGATSVASISLSPAQVAICHKRFSVHFPNDVASTGSGDKASYAGYVHPDVCISLCLHRYTRLRPAGLTGPETDIVGEKYTLGQKVRNCLRCSAASLPQPNPLLPFDPTQPAPILFRFAPRVFLETQLARERLGKRRRSLSPTRISSAVFLETTTAPRRSNEVHLCLGKGKFSHDMKQGLSSSIPRVFYINYLV